MSIKNAIQQKVFRVKEILCRRHILIDKKHINWLGIEQSSIEKCLARKWLNAKFFEPDAKNNLFLNISSDFYMSDAITYLICNELECQPKELHNYGADIDNLISCSKEQASFVFSQAQYTISKIKPRCVILVQGYTMESAALRAACIENSIPFIVLENTARNDKILWENFSGINVNQNLAANYYWRYRDSIKPDIFNLYHQTYIKNQKAFKSSEHITPTKPYLSIDKKPLLTWIGQVYTDSSVIFGLNPGFKTPVDCIKTLLLFALEHDCRVFLKMHPKEYLGINPFQKSYNCLTARKLRADIEVLDLINKLGDRVTFDDQNYFDTYSVIEASKLVVTINSQAGLESTIRNIPTILCGRAFYGNLGFTRDAYGPEELLASIGSCVNNDVDFSLNEARCFNYIFFEKYCIFKSPDALSDLVSRMLLYRKNLFFNT